jgi:hypothetical protein
MACRQNKASFYINLRNLWLLFFSKRSQNPLAGGLALVAGGYFFKTNPISTFFSQKSTLINRQCAKRTQFCLPVAFLTLPAGSLTLWYPDSDMKGKV